MKLPVLRALVGTCACLIALSACDEPRKSDPSIDLPVTNVHLEKSPHGTRHIVGTLRNNSMKTYGYVNVSFNLYDAAGTQVGDADASISNLEPGKSWNFEAVIVEDKAVSYKLMKVTAF